MCARARACPSLFVCLSIALSLPLSVPLSLFRSATHTHTHTHIYTRTRTRTPVNSSANHADSACGRFVPARRAEPWPRRGPGLNRTFPAGPLRLPRSRPGHRARRGPAHRHAPAVARGAPRLPGQYPPPRVAAHPLRLDPAARCAKLSSSGCFNKTIPPKKTKRAYAAAVSALRARPALPLGVAHGNQ